MDYDEHVWDNPQHTYLEGSHVIGLVAGMVVKSKGGWCPIGRAMDLKGGPCNVLGGKCKKGVFVAWGL